jgi:hypothetical protein
MVPCGGQAMDNGGETACFDSLIATAQGGRLANAVKGSALQELTLQLTFRLMTGMLPQ